MDLNTLGVERAGRRDWVIAGLVLLILALVTGALIHSIDAAEPAVFRASTDRIVAVNPHAVSVTFTVTNISTAAAIPACVVTANGPTGDYSENALGTSELAARASIHSTVSIVIINGGALRIALPATAIHCDPAIQ
jgi:hypothetical protein